VGTTVVTSPVTAGTPTGSIYDLGYRGYDGPRLGRTHAIRSLFSHSLRSTYGIGRGMRAKLAPIFLLVFAVIPPIAILGALVLAARLGESAGELVSANAPIRYDTMFTVLSSAGIIVLFCAAQAPELFGRDQRHGTLSLYFARALRRTDYALARMLGFVAALMFLLLAPQTILFLGRVLLSPDIVDGFLKDAPSILPILGQSLLAALLYGGLAMTISAYTPRRAYAVAGIIALLVIPGVIAQVVTGLGSSTIGTWLTLISPSTVLDGTNAVLFDRPFGQDFFFVQLPDIAYFAAAAVGIVGSFAISIRRFQQISV
jgi:ABC-2 type transport system permease protein